MGYESRFPCCLPSVISPTSVGWNLMKWLVTYIANNWIATDCPRENRRGKTERKQNPHFISWQPWNGWTNKLSMCQHEDVSQTLPGSGSPQGDSQEGQMCTKLSLNLLIMGTALTRKNILSDKNSHLGEGKNLIIWRGFSSHYTPYTHLQSFLHKSNHLCYSLLEGAKPGSSMLENAEETLPVCLVRGRLLQRTLAKRDLLYPFSWKLETEAIESQAFREKGMAWSHIGKPITGAGSHLDLWPNQVQKDYMCNVNWWGCSLWFHERQGVFVHMFLEVRVCIIFGSHKPCHMLRESEGWITHCPIFWCITAESHPFWHPENINRKIWGEEIQNLCLGLFQLLAGLCCFS